MTANRLQQADPQRLASFALFPVGRAAVGCRSCQSWGNTL